MNPVWVSVHDPRGVGILDPRFFLNALNGQRLQLLIENLTQIHDNALMYFLPVKLVVSAKKDFNIARRG